MNKFKVGDKVQIIKAISSIGRDLSKGSFREEIGKITTITDFSDGLMYPYKLENVKDAWKDEELKLISNGEDCCPNFTISNEMEFTGTLTAQSGTIEPKKSIMSNIIDFAKNLALSADEKLLRKQGLKDSCGDYTGEAKEIAIQKLCKEKEVELIEIAKAKELEEKK